MEFDQIKGGLEDHLVESRNKIEHLTAMIQTLTDSKKGSNGNDILKRIESKLDIVAEAGSSEYVDTFLSDIKADLEEKQILLDSKITSIEELAGQINNLLKEQSLDQTSQKQFDSFRSEIGNLSNELSNIQENINFVNNQIVELNKNSQQTNNIVCNISDKQALEYIKSATDSLDLNINATLSALSILDLKVKSISENLEKLSSLDSINLIKDDMTQVSIKINGLLEIVKSSSTVSDVEDIKDEINFVNAKFIDLQNHLDPSINSIKESLNELFDHTSTDGIKHGLSNIEDQVSKLVENSQQTDNIDLIRNDVNVVLEKINGLSEKLGKISNAQDIEQIKDEINSVNSKFGELQEHIIFSINKLKENVNETLSRELKGELSNATTNIADKFEDVKNEISSTQQEIQDLSSTLSFVASKVPELEHTINSLNVRGDIEELRNSVNDLFLKDDTKPLIDGLDQIQSRIGELEYLTKNNFEPKLTKIQDDFYIFQDKLNISISSLIKPINEELMHLNEKILDLKEYFTFKQNNEKEYKDELAVVAERFNDIWTSAGLTLDRLNDQVLVTDETTNKFQNTVKRFFDISEDTSIIITNILKKTTDISTSLGDVNNRLGNKLDNLTGNLDIESQKIQDCIYESNTGLTDKLTSLIEADLNFLRSDIIEFKDKQEKVLQDNITSQESIQNSLSNLHFSVTDSTDSLVKKISDLGLELYKLNDSSSETVSNTEVVKDALVQIAGWIDSAQELLTETNSNVQEIKKSNEIKQVLTELITLKGNLAKNSTNLGGISTRIENNLSETRDEIKTSLNVIKKRQEYDFDNINTNISGVSQELFTITQSFTSFENKIKNDIQLLNNSISEKLESQKEVYPVEKLEANIEAGLVHIKDNINVEFKKISSKFNTLESNLENMEEKLNRLETRLSINNDDQEIKQILEFIAGQVTATNENGKGTGLLLKKISVLEKRMTDFDTSLKKVADFLDAE